jgi:hypothetical protein
VPSISNARVSQGISHAPLKQGPRSGYHLFVAGALETKGPACAGLYERLVGDGWDALDEPVRRLHLCARGEGVFAVRRGEGRAARAVARLMGLPRGGEAVPLRLSVEPHGGGERWRRTFAGQDFVTEQSEHAARLLAERTFFRVRGLRVGLPRLLAPRVEAWERADEGGGVRVEVRVTAPLCGPLISYEGLVRLKEAEG